MFPLLEFLVLDCARAMLRHCSSTDYESIRSTCRAARDAIHKHTQSLTLVEDVRFASWAPVDECSCLRSLRLVHKPALAAAWDIHQSMWLVRKLTDATLRHVRQLVLHGYPLTDHTVTWLERRHAPFLRVLDIRGAVLSAFGVSHLLHQWRLTLTYANFENGCFNNASAYLLSSAHADYPCLKELHIKGCLLTSRLGRLALALSKGHFPALDSLSLDGTRLVDGDLVTLFGLQGTYVVCFSDVFRFGSLQRRGR